MDAHHTTIPALGAELARREINLLAVTDTHILYEYSYINRDTKMKKWAKRLVALPISHSDIAAVYQAIIDSVEAERAALTEGRI